MSESQLKIYNTYTREKEVFKPLHPPQVKMYVCGPTVYNFLHVGNFRGPVVFNMVRQWLEAQNYNVFFALNFTDVDDRIIDKAQQEGKTSLEISERYIAEYKKDFHSLGLKPHDLNPKVTESMPGILKIIQGLIDQKKAYVQDGDVLFAIDQFENYGKLSGRKTEELLSGTRVDSSHKLKSPLDFALWKGSKAGEPAWPSPWGPGRPGWHIECSAMICEHLGEQIDIHGGGLDLIFPHHENEIAQSEGFTQKKFVNTWMHVNMLNLSGQKMSKSVGNIVSLREFLETNHPEIYKWMILSVHYRSVLDFGEESIQRAILGLAKVYSSLSLAESYLVGASVENLPADPGFEKVSQTAWQKVTDSLNDDFNTPEAFAAMYEVIKTFNSQVRRGGKVTPAMTAKAIIFKKFILKLGQILSLFQENANQFLLDLDDRLLEKMNVDRKTVDALVQERALARTQKNFPLSDELRKKLTDMKIQVSDTNEGSFWEVDKHS